MLPAIYLTSHRVRIWHKAVSWWGPRTNQNSFAVGAKMYYSFGAPQAPSNKLSPVSRQRPGGKLPEVKFRMRI